MTINRLLTVLAVICFVLAAFAAVAIAPLNVLALIAAGLALWAGASLV